MSGARARIPPGVWKLGFVSLLMDASSKLVHALLPLYSAFADTGEWKHKSIG